MTSRMQLLRLLGDIVTVLGAWFQMLWIIGVGVIVILLGWARGLFLPQTKQREG